VNAAVDAARAAFPSWSALSPMERSRYMNRLADLIESNLERLVEAESKVIQFSHH
jgi:acyl-CoA reductase-like NAD-dependent aldehyde dehydrogenase